MKTNYSIKWRVNMNCHFWFWMCLFTYVYCQVQRVFNLVFIQFIYSINIFSHFKLCLATAIHNFKWLKIRVICEIQVTQISVSRLKAYLTDYCRHQCSKDSCFFCRTCLYGRHTLHCTAQRQYLLICKVSRYFILTLQCTKCPHCVTGRRGPSFCWNMA